MRKYPALAWQCRWSSPHWGDACHNVIICAATGPGPMRRTSQNWISSPWWVLWAHMMVTWVWPYITPGNLNAVCDTKLPGTESSRRPVKLPIQSEKLNKQLFQGFRFETQLSGLAGSGWELSKVSSNVCINHVPGPESFTDPELPAPAEPGSVVK